MTPLHTAIAIARGGREGFVKSANGLLDLRLAMPRALGGPGDEAGTNPEQLFAAGYAACFESTLRLIARRRSLDLGEVSVTAEVTIGKEGEGYALAANIVGHMPGTEQGLADELMQAAHEACPYSKATRGNMDVALRAETSSTPPQPGGPAPQTA